MELKDIAKLSPTEKIDLMGELQYTKGYATALRDFLKMTLHLKGKTKAQAITFDEIAELAHLAIESQPLYQEYKKEHPEMFKDEK